MAPALRRPRRIDSARLPGARAGTPPLSRSQQLKELFPTWDDDDLHAALAEHKHDVDATVQAIVDGTTVAWSTVDQKKAKKPAGAPAADANAKPAGNASSARSSTSSGSRFGAARDACR